jgi:hypothetical protein
MSEGVGRTGTFYMENSAMSDHRKPRITGEHRAKVLLVNLLETSVWSPELHVNRRVEKYSRTRLRVLTSSFVFQSQRII